MKCFARKSRHSFSNGWHRSRHGIHQETWCYCWPDWSRRTNMYIAITKKFEVIELGYKSEVFNGRS